MTTLDELRRVALFDGFSDEELASILEGGEERLVRAGEVNGREGEPVEHLYVILDGDLRITNRCSTGSPSRPFTSPARTSFSSPSSKTRPSSSSKNPSKSATWRSSSRVVKMSPAPRA